MAAPRALGRRQACVHTRGLAALTATREGDTLLGTTLFLREVLPGQSLGLLPGFFMIFTPRGNYHDFQPTQKNQKLRRRIFTLLLCSVATLVLLAGSAYAFDFIPSRNTNRPMASPIETLENRLTILYIAICATGVSTSLSCLLLFFISGDLSKIAKKK